MRRRIMMIVLAAFGGWPLGTVGVAADRGVSQPPLTVARTQMTTLIMVDDPACHYCRRWDTEVGGGYHLTAEGRAAPLKRVSRASKALSNFAPVIYTPTFILEQNGNELGRITGYPGQLYFWEELSQLMSSAGIDTKG